MMRRAVGRVCAISFCLAAAAWFSLALLTGPGSLFPSGLRISGQREQEGFVLIRPEGWDQARWLGADAFAPGPAVRLNRIDLHSSCVDAPAEIRAELDRLLQSQPSNVIDERALWVRVIAERRIGAWPCGRRRRGRSKIGVQVRILRLVAAPRLGCSNFAYMLNNLHCPVQRRASISGNQASD